MKRWVLAGAAVGHALRLGVVEAIVDLAKAAVEIVENWISSAWEWHRRRMVTDPSYPIALLAIGKAVVRIVVPQAALATALIAVIAEILGGFNSSWPDRYDDDWGEDF